MKNAGSCCCWPSVSVMAEDKEEGDKSRIGWLCYLNATTNKIIGVLCRYNKQLNIQNNFVVE